MNAQLHANIRMQVVHFPKIYPIFGEVTPSGDRKQGFFGWALLKFQQFNRPVRKLKCLPKVGESVKPVFTSKSKHHSQVFVLKVHFLQALIRGRGTTDSCPGMCFTLASKFADHVGAGWVWRKRSNKDAWQRLNDTFLFCSNIDLATQIKPLFISAVLRKPEGVCERKGVRNEWHPHNKPRTTPSLCEYWVHARKGGSERVWNIKVKMRLLFWSLSTSIQILSPSQQMKNTSIRDVFVLIEKRVSCLLMLRFFVCLWFSDASMCNCFPTLQGPFGSMWWNFPSVLNRKTCNIYTRAWNLAGFYHGCLL